MNETKIMHAMTLHDLIIQKRDGGVLSDEAVRFFVRELPNLPESQVAALLMAIYFRGMNDAETLALTLAMAASGETADPAAIPGCTADKHSTGGVGDKTTLVVGPMVAACGVTVAKMSGPGLGHTGGTVDKLSAIPGFRCELPKDEFMRIVREVGLCLAGQSGNLAPADKRIYALRDQIGAVESIPLIAASIMSKKLAAGADCIVLDVKYGSGAFMKTRADAVVLAEKMVAIGRGAGRKMAYLVTDMNMPQGTAIGNALEVAEAVDILSGNIANGDLRDLCLELSAEMLRLAERGTLAECRALAEGALTSGAALAKFREMVRAQGGDPDATLPRARFRKSIHISYLSTMGAMDMQAWGTAAMKLGAGREKPGDAIDYAAGILLYKKPGDEIRAGETIAELHYNDKTRLAAAERVLEKAFVITK